MIQSELTKALEQAVHLGYEIIFRQSLNQVEIKVAKIKDDVEVGSLSQMLPLDDHFYDAKLASCINYMLDKINYVINKPTTKKQQ